MKPTPGIFVSFPVNSVGLAASVPVVPVIFTPETPRIARPTVSLIVVVRPIGVPFSSVKLKVTRLLFGAPACEAPASLYSTGTVSSSPTLPSLTTSLISKVGGVPSFHAVPPNL